MYKLITESNTIPENFTGIVELGSGTKYWYLNGNYHRLDGPAMEGWNGTKVWFFEGKRHRIDGPAIEYSDGAKEYWINDEQVSEKQHKKYINNLNMSKNTCDGKLVEIDGKKYKLISVD